MGLPVFLIPPDNIPRLLARLSQEGFQTLAEHEGCYVVSSAQSQVRLSIEIGELASVTVLRRGYLPLSGRLYRRVVEQIVDLEGRAPTVEELERHIASLDNLSD